MSDPTDQMLAACYDSYGPPSSVQVRSMERPAPDDDSVLIEVAAASINPFDLHNLSGTPYLVRMQGGLRRPKRSVVGVDVAGTVVAVGSGVDRFAPGDEVFGSAEGACAEYAVASVSSVVAKPVDVDFEAVAACPVAGLTALQGLRDKGGVEAGSRVLVNGASGGVGTFAVQIAKVMGAHVTGVCSGRNVDLVLSIGADVVVDYTTNDFTEATTPYDVVFDAVGNRSPREIKRVMTDDGVYVIAGGSKKGRVLGPMKHMVRSVAAFAIGSRKAAPFIAAIKPKDLVELGAMLASGEVTPVIDSRHQLNDIVPALEHLATGRARGKVIITP